MPVEGLAQNSAGLSLVNLNVLLSQGGTRGLDVGQFRKLKKGMIERQCQGLVEFVEPPHRLDLLVGQPQAKARLEQDAAWITQGKLETAPMGYLFLWPGRNRQDLFRRVLRRLNWHPLPQAPQLPLQIRGRDRREHRAGAHGAAVTWAGCRHCR